ncbi:MAG: ABC transporter ATP-binding protein [Geminicoccaceae bacterium]
MTILSIQDLTIAFGSRRVVDGVSFDLRAGETLALVGESGSGKSLTALSILRLLPTGAAACGRILLAGQEMLSATQPTLEQARGGIAGMVFQEPMTSLNPLHRIGRQVAEAIALHGRRPTSAQVTDLLARVGFPDAEHRLDAFPHQLSGGQRQRVMIAMALANDPKLLIADEPTTALDVTIQAGILDLLAAEKRRRGLALLLISHDLNVVRRVADRVCVMKDGVLVESGSVSTLFRAPKHPYTRMLIAAEPSGKPTQVPDAAPLVAEARDLGVTFAIRRGLLRRAAGEVRAVDGVSLQVREGETLGLVGESGSGKSTIGQAMLRLQPATGRILFERRDITSLPQSQVRKLRRRMQIVFQDPYGSLSPRMSVAEIIAEGLRVHEPRLGAAARMERVESALAEVGLAPDSAQRYPHEFSGGQRQRIAVARAIVLKPRLVVLDEPTSALDRSVQSQLIDLLRTLQQLHGLAYLFISHDLAVVRALAHRVAVLQAGRVVEQGPADALFARPQTAYAAALMAAAFSEDPTPAAASG